MSGAWIQTFTGRQFWPLEPKPEDVVLEDIAHALSNICRYTGHVRKFYSVAEHSVRASRVIAELCEAEKLTPEATRDLIFVALLHDAAEAYICDIAAPVKRYMYLMIGDGAETITEPIEQIELRIWSCIAHKFNACASMIDHPLVRQADMVMLSTERRDLLGPEPASWGTFPDPHPITIEPWPSTAAKQLFQETFELRRPR